MLNHSDIHRYLLRIGVETLPEAPRPRLDALHLAHLRHIPFENLDVIFQKTIIPGLPATYDKVVERRRGGFCFELNYCFYVLLKSLGFDVQMLAGQVWNEEGFYGRPFDHLFVLVKLPQETVLADISFGDAFSVPLPIDGQVSHERDVSFRVEDCYGEYRLLKRSPTQAWQPLYKFSLQPRQLHEFDEMLAYHQHSPASPFTSKALCTRLTPEGRITLSDNKLIVTRYGQKTEQSVGSVDEYVCCLRERFGIELPAEYNLPAWFERCGVVTPQA
ncbi:arylamine N-acetyltransferase family protein [Musicola paradisiaca]|uniref:N-acetyltransferase n=1 Tax=Musicola paradisiaca (strain Ech703) TaxID=579405 RepID=C6C3R5_MUSP7|nr:arylamine N-acetyltransferase [Musicola paradisiaca]ACS85410.1 N-acetyltransferase [Musicola paradisiaca Ech703]